MSHALLVARFKIRQFFGPVLKSKKALVGLVFLFLLLLPAGFGFAFVLPELAAGPETLETFSAVASGFLSLLILLSFAGGLLVHQSEIDFLLPTPLSPRSYALGDFGFQVFTGIAFGSLFGFSALLGLLLLSPLAWTNVLGLTALFVSFLLFAVVLSQSLGLFRMVGKRRRLLLPVVLLALLNLPALQFVAETPLRYGSLPLPSTAFAVVALSLLSGVSIDPRWPILLGFYAGFLLVFYWAVNGAYYFPHVRPTMTAGFGASPFRTSAIQQERMVRGLGALTKRVRLSPRGRFGGYVVRYHMVRLFRDGSLLFVSFFLLIFLVMGTQVLGGIPTTALAGLLGYPAILAIILLGLNWLASERENTWVLLTSPRGTGDYFRALLWALLTVGGLLLVVAAFLLAVTGHGFQLTALLAAGAGVITGASVLVLLLEVWRIPAGGFSLRILLLFVLPAMAFALGSLSITAFLSFPSFVTGIGLPPGLLAVGVLLLLVGGFMVVVRAASRRFSLEIPAPQ